ncbi:Uncharacterised protein [Mycobacteroides abscessus]|nr:Uncharacterised protein [Mycobacteroides abscessus]
MTPISWPRFSKQKTCSTPGSAPSAAVRSAHASMIVRTRCGGRAPKDVRWSLEKHTTSHRPAAGAWCWSGASSTTASGTPGTCWSDGKRFSKTTTS